jgi:hypothetical protein
VSKKRRWLDVALHVFMAYRNLVRRRFNRDPRSCAEHLGFAPRRLTPGEVLSWRQDGGKVGTSCMCSSVTPSMKLEI